MIKVHDILLTKMNYPKINPKSKLKKKNPKLNNTNPKLIVSDNNNNHLFKNIKSPCLNLNNNNLRLH
jgi:hypothetical protein